MYDGIANGMNNSHSIIFLYLKEYLETIHAAEVPIENVKNPVPKIKRVEFFI